MKSEGSSLPDVRCIAWLDLLGSPRRDDLFVDYPLTITLEESNQGPGGHGSSVYMDSIEAKGLDLCQPLVRGVRSNFDLLDVRC